MTALKTAQTSAPLFPHRHLLGIEGLSRDEIVAVLDLSDHYANHNRSRGGRLDVLDGRTCVNLFFEDSTRTRTSFELAGKRLGADVINISVGASSIKKGETLIDTAMTLNAMHADVLVVRHRDAGAVKLLSEKVNCAVVNGGDGSHEHPTQALLDALTIRRRKGRLAGLKVVLCGDVAHSRVARSNIFLLRTLGATVRVVAPPTLMPAGLDRDVEAFTDMTQGLADCDIVMMLRLQKERMEGSFVPSVREYFHFYGLDRAKLAHAKPDALVMHPGPMNRGVEIDSDVADDIDRSLIQEQVEMGVAVRMACLDMLWPAGRNCRRTGNRPRGAIVPGPMMKKTAIVNVSLIDPVNRVAGRLRCRWRRADRRRSDRQGRAGHPWRRTARWRRDYRWPGSVSGARPGRHAGPSVRTGCRA